jgi:hypothetical protein
VCGRRNFLGFWTDRRSSLRSECNEIVGANPDAAAAIQQVFQVLCQIEDVASFTPASVGESTEWAAIVRAAEDKCESFCKALHGKPLFSALYGTYTMTLDELKGVLKASSQAGQAKQADGFKEVRRRKRHPRERQPALPKRRLWRHQ